MDINFLLQFYSGLFRGNIRCISKTLYIKCLIALLQVYQFTIRITSYNVCYTKLLRLNFRDITERKKVELSLKQSEARYALVIDASEQGIWDWNRNNFV